MHFFFTFIFLMAYWDITLLGAGVDKPLEGTGADKPLEGTGADKPLEGTGADKPLEGTGVDKPLEGTGADKPLEGTGADKPLEGTGDSNDDSPDYCPTSPSPNACMCKALNYSNVQTASKEELDKMLATLIAILKIDKKTTSYNKRKLISAPDNRTSSRSIGFVAIVVICVPVVFVVVMDISRFVSWWRHGDPKSKHRKPNVRKKKFT